jgi:hypothetical protein
VNLFDGTYSESGKELASNGATATNVNWSITQYISIVGGEKYTVCNGKAVGSAIAACFYDADKTYISGFSYNVQVNITTTAPANARYIRAAVLSNPEHPSYNADVFMIVKSPTVPTTYIPYGYEIPISVQGENLFNISTMVDPDSAGKYLKNDGTTGNDAAFAYTTYIPIAAQRVRLDNVVGGAASICCYDANKNFIRGQVYYQQSVILLNTSDAAFVRFSLKPVMQSNAALFGLNDYTFYIGGTPLTEGETVSKTSTGQDIELFEGENTVSTTLYNKPETSITYTDYIGVGEYKNGQWQIPLTLNDSDIIVPIDAPLVEGESVNGTFTSVIGNNTLDTTLSNKPNVDIDLGSRINIIENNLTTINDRLTNSEDDIATLSGYISTMSEQITTMAADIEELKSKSNPVNGYIPISVNSFMTTNTTVEEVTE